MNREEATNQILNSIAKDCELEVSKLHLLGITKDQIRKAIDDCVKRGVSVKQSINTIVKIWKQSEPNHSSHPSAPEMDLLGFTKHGDTWTHEKAGVTITEQERQSYSFFTIEQMCIHGLADKQKNP